MKKVVNYTEIFYAGDFEKIEKWLNDMSEKGLELIAVKPQRYFFKKSDKLIKYKLDFLIRMSKKEKGEYIDFLQSTGIDIVTSKAGMYYFKKTTIEDFDIFSDNLSYINRIARKFAIMFTRALSMGFLTGLLIYTLISFKEIMSVFPILFFIGVSVVILGLLITLLAVYGCVKSKKKIKKLKENNYIYENQV